jgi:hypothetical protein
MLKLEWQSASSSSSSQPPSLSSSFLLSFSLPLFLLLTDHYLHHSLVPQILCRSLFRTNLIASVITINRINEIDDAIGQILQNASKADDQEYKAKVAEMVQTIRSKGQKLEDKELIESDIIIPDTDISIDEAKKVFQGEGIIPEI